jgi:hypothetical protein
MMAKTEEGDEGHAEGAKDAVIEPINHKDAEWLDGFIRKLRKLSPEHWFTVRDKFYKRIKNGPGELEIGAAERALQDIIEHVRSMAASAR